MVVSKKYGYKILSTEPPVKIGRIEGKAKVLLGKKWQEKREN